MLVMKVSDHIWMMANKKVMRRKLEMLGNWMVMKDCTEANIAMMKWHYNLVKKLRRKKANKEVNLVYIYHQVISDCTHVEMKVMNNQVNKIMGCMNMMVMSLVIDLISVN